ncbi:hypothetical protein F444_21534 [Phytophthora nicotianae P1976]|uniref:Uncharacterized protein n=1 Tax=Phytophthora nicotianae P1976 TaxID=1317066 RepID=A0A080Z0T9_PHYNI|nr:hypothetical protein F444_21534 [Phytophthora nicotianae P1976]
MMHRYTTTPSDSTEATGQDPLETHPVERRLTLGFRMETPEYAAAETVLLARFRQSISLPPIALE